MWLGHGGKVREKEIEKKVLPTFFFFPKELFRESYLYNDSWVILERVFTLVQFPLCPTSCNSIRESEALEKHRSRRWGI